LTGEVNAGQEWSSDVGDGWIFRLVPIASSGKPYTGWDLVLEPKRIGGYPDALLLGTPPYGSLNEREIGTTFGLRAQDAIAWGPRRFHFFTSEKDLASARELFAVVTSRTGAVETKNQSQASAELLNMASDKLRSGSGEFEVLDAKLVLGMGDPAVFAQQWAARLARVPHTIVPENSQTVSQTTFRGELRWIRFRAAIWLPGRWVKPARLPPGSTFEAAKCPQ
jgi:hypothetical protein